MRDPILEQLARLRLRGIDAALDAELDRAEAEGSPACEVIWRLFAAQEAARRKKSLPYRLTQAKLPWHWALESFPFDRQPGVDRGQIRALAGLDFLRRNENILLTGPPGTGKAGIAIPVMRDTRKSPRAERSTPKLLAKLARFQPMLIDELGYLTLKPEQSNAFFRLMDQRYGRVSTIITTNLEPSAWYECFANKALVAALLARLQHRCITIRIDGPSLRTPEPPAPASADSAPKSS